MRRIRPVFTIRHLMILVAAAAGLSWLYRSVNLYGFVALLVYGAWIAGFSMLLYPQYRHYRREALRAMTVAGTLEFLAMASLSVFVLRFSGLVYKMLISTLFLPIVIASGVAWVVAATSSEASPKRSPWTAWPLVAVLVVVPVSMMFSHWPVRLAFLASRPALNRLAERIESGESLDHPEWAGAFLIRKVSDIDAGPGNLALVILNDSTRHTRLIRAASPSTRPLIEDYQPTALFRFAHDTRWWYHERD